jgi:hypothetical protein
MTLSLPPSIDHYFAGKNARDFAAAAAGFALAAVVKDEERRHEGQRPSAGGWRRPLRSTTTNQR